MVIGNEERVLQISFGLTYVLSLSLSLSVDIPISLSLYHRLSSVSKYFIR